VTVKLTVVNRQATVSMIPSSSSLVMKALNEPPRDKKKVKGIKHDGNLTLDQVIDIAKQMRDRSMAKKLAGTVKEILGTCNSVGCTVNGESPRDIQSSIDDGEIEIPEE
jgi:large subunit ribosomal protein L12e